MHREPTPTAAVMGSLEQTVKSTLMTVPTPIPVRMEEIVKMVSTHSAVNVPQVIQVQTVKSTSMTVLTPIPVRMEEHV